MRKATVDAWIYCQAPGHGGGICTSYERAVEEMSRGGWVPDRKAGLMFTRLARAGFKLRQGEVTPIRFTIEEVSPAVPERSTRALRRSRTDAVRLAKKKEKP